MKLASIAEPQPILCKHFANERKESLLSICRVQLSVMQKYIFPLTPPNFLDSFNVDIYILPTDLIKDFSSGHSLPLLTSLPSPLKGERQFDFLRKLLTTHQENKIM